MPAKAAFLQYSRKVHLYFGLFISPALMFFAFTGGYQTLGLHEASSDYKPPAILASLGQIHKKQTYVIPVRRGPAPGAASQNSEAKQLAGVQDRARPDAAPSGRHEGGTADAGSAEPMRQDTPTSDAAHASTAAPRSADAAPGRSAGGQQPTTLAAKQRQHLPLKIFFLVVSLGLFTSTLTGIYMAYKYDRNPVLVTVLLLAGAILPLVLVNF